MRIVESDCEDESWEQAVSQVYKEEGIEQTQYQENQQKSSHKSSSTQYQMQSPQSFVLQSNQGKPDIIDSEPQQQPKFIPPKQQIDKFSESESFDLLSLEKDIQMQGNQNQDKAEQDFLTPQDQVPVHGYYQGLSVHTLSQHQQNEQQQKDKQYQEYQQKQSQIQQHKEQEQVVSKKQQLSALQFDYQQYQNAQLQVGYQQVQIQSTPQSLSIQNTTAQQPSVNMTQESQHTGYQNGVYQFQQQNDRSQNQATSASPQNSNYMLSNQSQSYYTPKQQNQNLNNNDIKTSIPVETPKSKLISQESKLQYSPQTFVQSQNLSQTPQTIQTQQSQGSFHTPRYQTGDYQQSDTGVQFNSQVTQIKKPMYQQQINHTLITGFTQYLSLLNRRCTVQQQQECLNNVIGNIAKQSVEFQRLYKDSADLGSFINNCFNQAYQQVLYNQVVKTVLQYENPNDFIHEQGPYIVNNLPLYVQLLKRLPQALEDCQLQLIKIYTSKIKDDEQFDSYLEQPFLLRLFSQIIALMVQNKLIKLRFIIQPLCLFIDEFENVDISSDSSAKAKAWVISECFLQLMNIVEDAYQQIGGSATFESLRQSVLKFKCHHFDQSSNLWKSTERSFIKQAKNKTKTWQKDNLQDQQSLEIKFVQSFESLHSKEIHNIMYEPQSNSIVSSNKRSEVVISTLEGQVITRLDSFNNDIFEIDRFGSSGFVLLTERPSVSYKGAKKFCHLMDCNDLENIKLYGFPLFLGDVKCIRALTYNVQFMATVSQNSFQQSRFSSVASKYQQQINLHDMSRVSQGSSAPIAQTIELKTLGYDELKSDIRCCSKVLFNPSLFLTGAQWVQLWDFRDQKKLIRLFGHQVEGVHQQTCMAVDGDASANIVVTGGKDFEVKLWDMRQERQPLLDVSSYQRNLKWTDKSKNVKLDTSIPLQVKILESTSFVACSTPHGLYTINTKDWNLNGVQPATEPDAKFYQAIDWVQTKDSVSGLLAAKRNYLDSFRLKV